MVHYSLDLNTRLKIYFICAGISIVISFGISEFQSILPIRLIAPSAIMIYGGLLWFFDNYVWKFRIVKNFIDIPNLNGSWSGIVKRTGNEEIFIKLVITQTWTKIDFITEGLETISQARSAHISIENKNNITVLFVYKVKGKTGLERSSVDGDGVTELYYKKKDDNEILEGPYYSSKLRKGYFKVIKI